MTGHGFDDGPEGHGAAFGVGGFAQPFGGGDLVEQQEVPVAGGVEHAQGGVEVVVGVARGPLFLVEGLDDGSVNGEGLAEAEGKDEFAVG